MIVVSGYAGSGFQLANPIERRRRMVDSSPIHVLLIEDNASDAQLIELLLGEAHHNSYVVSIATTLLDGMLSLEDRVPDVILLALSLPDGLGLGSLDLVMALTVHIPVIVLAGLDDDMAGLEAINKGAQDYLVKGEIEGRTLARAIRYAIERNRVEQALQGSETRFRMLSENTPVGVYMIQNAIFTYVNPALAQFFGYTPEEMTGQSILEGIHPDDRKLVEEEIRQRVEGEVKIAQYEFRGLHKDGSSFDCEIIGSVIFTQYGVPTIIGTIQDVSARKSTLETLENERSLLRTLIDNLPDLIYAKDTDARFILSNTAHARLVGADSADALLGKSDLDIHPQQNALQYLANDKGVLEAGQSLVNKEDLVFDSQGNTRWVQTTKVPLFNPVGEVTGLVGIGHDITQRKQVEEALRVSEDRFRILSELSSDYAYSIAVEANGDSRIEWATQAFTDITGYTIEDSEANGRWQSIVHPDDLDYVGQRVKKLYIGQPDTREYRIISKDGETRWIHERCLPVFDDVQNRVVRIYGAVRDITEQKQTEEALRESEERYRRVAELISDYAYAFRVYENGTYENEWVIGRFEAITGYTMAEIKALGGWMYMIHPDDQDLTLERAERLVTGEQDVSEFRIVRKDGTTRWMRDHAHPVWDPEGKQVIRVYGAVQDITERKRTAVLIEKQNRDLGILNRIISLSNSTLEIDQILDITCREMLGTFSANRVMAAMWDEKYEAFQVVMEAKDSETEESAVGKVFIQPGDPILDYIGRYNIPLIVDESNQAQYPCRPCVNWGQTALFVPLKVRSRLHTIFWIVYNGPRQFTDVDISLVASIIQAISQTFENSLLHQQVTEQNTHLANTVTQRTSQLRHMNKRLTTILNNASDAILLLDRDNRIRNTNLAFSRMFEYEHDELFNQRIGVLVESDQLAALEKTLVAAREKGQPQRLEIPVLTKRGRTFDSDIALAFVKDNDGHMVCSIRDISHLKEVEKVKDRFVSMVSHELRTPISSIMLSSGTLDRHYDRLTDAQKRRKLSQIAEQSERLANLVTSILDVSRFDTRRGRRGDSLIDVAQALKDVVMELTDQAATKQQHVETQYYNEVMTTRGDYTDVAHIWRNLLSNAIKYTDVEGQIQLTLYGGTNGGSPRHLPNLAPFANSVPEDIASGRYVIGLVEDNGHGIRPEDMDQLFTRFFRGWASGTNITGTGLGLSLIRDTLQLYGGDIAVSSVLNTGTTFCFWLPVEPTKGDIQ